MTTPVEAHKKKIADEQLWDFLLSDTDERVQVILEVDAPEPVVAYRREPREGTVGTRPEFVEISKEAKTSERQAIEETRSLLDSMHIESRFLRSSRVFLVEIDPEQLRRIVAAPTIRSVIPNRRFSINP